MAAPSTLAALALDPGKPDVPDLEPIDLQTVLRDTIGANLGNIGDIKKLSSIVNRFNANQSNAVLARLFPGAAGIGLQASGAIQDMLAGKLSESTLRNIQTLFAERGTSMGTGGSTFNLAGEAAEIGRTTEDIIGSGLNHAARWLAQQQARVPLFNPASMFASTELGWRNAVLNQENQFNRDWMAEQVDKSLGMFEQSIMNSMQQMDQLILQGSSMAMGMGMGGMGGMGGGSFPSTNLAQPSYGPFSSYIGQQPTMGMNPSPY